MKKLLSTFIFCALSGTAMAGTGLNCYEADEMEGDTLGVCLQQTDEWLNGAYQQATKYQQEMDKTTKERVNLLKAAQLGWLKMRDADCQLRQLNAASFELGVAKDRCVIKANLQRFDYLETLH
jgi:uncharacterized protein YecT (DUF1311 family)